MPQPKNKNQTYKILVSSTQGRTITIVAPSPELACRKLQRQIAGKPRAANDISSALVWDVWSDPSASGEEWLISPAAQDRENPEGVMSWNGNSIKTYRDIGSIFRKSAITKHEE
jgi:hypothetical protein